LALSAALLETIELADAGGRPTPPSWRSIASRALGWARTVQGPDGTYPLFNDAAIDAAPATDAIIALGAAMGIDLDIVARRQAARRASVTLLESTGWLRADVGDACLILDAGPDAEGWQPGHAHADGLTFELWVDGKRLAVDFGVASYETGRAREETRATRVHNTVELLGIDSCEVWGAFRVGRRGHGRVRSCEVRGSSSSLELEHDGYAWLPGAPRHARTFELQPTSLEVRDRVVSGVGAQPWTSRLRVATSVAARARITGAGTVRRCEGAWYARHGQPSPALCFEQQSHTGSGQDVVWRVEW
jgi:hypothetical protein